MIYIMMGEKKGGNTMNRTLERIKERTIGRAGKGRVLQKAEARSFGKPDEVRTFPKGKLELITIGGVTIGRGTFEPGWRWSTSVQPLVKTKSCEAPHFQYQISGTIRIVMDDGTELECKAGDVSLLPVGHDAWVVGDEPVVVVDFQGMADYAKRSPGH